MTSGKTDRKKEKKKKRKKKKKKRHLQEHLWNCNTYAIMKQDSKMAEQI